MTSDELSRRFGWWWHNPAKALPRAFPDKSEDAIKRYVWPEYQLAAFNYELASRQSDKTKYLLGKPFHQLTAEQMSQVRKVWPRKRRPLRPIHVLAYDEAPDVVKTLSRIASRNELVLSSSAATDHAELVERTIRRTKRTEELEQNYARATGWTVPILVSFNLRECGDRGIGDAIEDHVAAERLRMDVPPPPQNKGRANRSARGLSFRRIEALDVRRNLPRAEADETGYDPAEKRRAAGEAEELLKSWRKAKEAAIAREQRIKETLAVQTPPQDMDAPNPLVAALSQKLKRARRG